MKAKTIGALTILCSIQTLVIFFLVGIKIVTVIIVTSIIFLTIAGIIAIKVFKFTRRQ